MEDYLKDVSDSSPDDDMHDEPTAEATPEGEGDKEGGRTIENVHREFSRKFETMMDRFERFEQMLNKPKPEPEKKSGNTLEDMSVAELTKLQQQLRSEDPDNPHLAELDSYINDRKVDEKVNNRLSAYEQQQQAARARQDANRQALDRYPDLKRRGSDFYMEVNKRLHNLGEDYRNANPRAVLDVANDVAAEMGVTPQTRRQVIHGAVGGRASGGGAPVRGSKDGAPEDRLPKNARSKEAREAIARRLASALPKGKKFDDKAIVERMSYYNENVGERLRG